MKLETSLCSELSPDDLLMSYVQGAQRTVESVDQLGNFLMGFGVLALGYLLNADLSAATRVLGVAPAGQQGLALVILAAWGLAVGLLVVFVWIYVFRVIAGRSVHAREGRAEGIGDVLSLPPELDWEGFLHHQRTFAQFIRHSYRLEDRATPESLLYARWSYVRFMTLRKLQAMERMRGLLGLAVVAGVLFKVLLVYQGAITPLA